MLHHVCHGGVGHGPNQALFKSARLLDFHWDTDVDVWKRPGLPCLSDVAAQIQHLQTAVLDGWRNEDAEDLCSGAGFGVRS